jgi:hypothetical protein
LFVEFAKEESIMERTGTHTKRSRGGIALCASALLVAATLSLGACRQEGTAQKAGQAIDEAKDKIADTLDPKGPVEKAGRGIDRATEN